LETSNCFDEGRDGDDGDESKQAKGPVEFRGNAEFHEFWMLATMTRPDGTVSDATGSGHCGVIRAATQSW
jgi:hypothetical protein